MTAEQKEARRHSAENGNIRWLKDNCLRTKDGEDDYVFISYKSDDFERVLDDIVYQVCRKYELRVYFDTAFDEDSDSWITQYYENMCDPKCKAFIAFLDDAYYSSYACLLEMMTRKTAAAGGDYKKDSLFFLPINIGSISEIISNANTGLGTRRFSNGNINRHAEEELKVFHEVFREVADDDMRNSIYKRENESQLYEEATLENPQYGKMYLNITQCRKLMEMVIPKSNDNDGSNKSFVEVIHDKLCNSNRGSVFGNPDPEVDSTVTLQNKEAKQTLKVNEDGRISESTTTEKKTILLTDFLKEYDNNSFKKSTYSWIRLVGMDGYEKYSTEFFDSAFELSWAFVRSLLQEKGKEYIESVNKKHPDRKNPMFISQEEYVKRTDQNKYRKIEVDGLENYYMYRHYGQYQWIDTVLKARLIEFGLPISKFYFEYICGDGMPEAAILQSSSWSGPGEKADIDADTGSNTVWHAGITGAKDYNGEKKENTVERINGRYSLQDFLAHYNNKTFQTTSCKTIQLIGVNECEQYSTDKYDTARNMVFSFAMKRLDELGIRYIEDVNSCWTGKNPIFITEEEHKERKARKESVTYKTVTSTAVKGYSICVHYSEYDWLKNSLMKQLIALKVSINNFYIVLDRN